MHLFTFMRTVLDSLYLSSSWVPGRAPIRLSPSGEVFSVFLVCKSVVVTTLCTICFAFIDLFCLLWVKKKEKDSNSLNVYYAIAINEPNKGIQHYYRLINEEKLPWRSCCDN